MFTTCDLCHERAHVQRVVCYGSSMQLCASCAQHQASMAVVHWSPAELGRLRFFRHLYQCGWLTE